MSLERPEAPEHQEKAKVDLSKLLAIIPPATELKGEKKAIREKRVRIRFDRSLDKPVARIPVHVANDIGVKSGDLVEIVVAGKRKAILTAEVVESRETSITVYPADLEKQGVADNSIVTIRRKEPQ
ncbi:MAG: hypothetical protein QXO87_01695 [Desulfurococcaceae archaeon]